MYRIDIYSAWLKIPVWSQTYMEIDHEIISTTTLTQEGWFVVSYKQKYAQQALLSQACPGNKCG